MKPGCAARAPVSISPSERRCRGYSPTLDREHETAYQSDACPGEIHIHIGAMDQPEDFPPHDTPAFPEDRVPWFHLAGHND